MPPAEFETTISARERPQTYALDRAAPGTGTYTYMNLKMSLCKCYRQYISKQKLFTEMQTR